MNLEDQINLGDEIDSCIKNEMEQHKARMRILHTADLHIGKMVNNFNILEDQKYVLTQMVEIVKNQNIQAFIIAGDVYDRPVPSAEAVAVFHWFIQQLHETGVTIFCISGIHDSAERLSFAKEILGEHGVHFAGTYEGKCKQVVLQDEYGPVVFTLMPFVKAALLQENTSQAAVRHMLEDICPNLEITVENDNVTRASDDKGVKENNSRESVRQVLVTHFFVTNAGKEPELSDSENHVAVGGLDNVDASLFKAFHYTALGHIHKPQRMDRENDSLNPVVYAGSPLAYSFSECTQEKSVVLVELDQNTVSHLERIPLKPLHKMRKLRGKLEDLISQTLEEHLDKEDYLQITLTNEEELIDPIGTLRTVYPNVMQLIFEKKEKESAGEFTTVDTVVKKTAEELFEDFYGLIREKGMDEARKNVIQDIIKELV